MGMALTHEVLRDRPGVNAIMLGNLAIVRGALEAGVQFFSCYPGTPASEVGDTFARIAETADIEFEYSVNEKVAVEMAFAASLTGIRSMCGMKHLGLNYAGDPLSTMPYVGVEGGMVIVSAGDPSAITSPNEQDQRHFSRFLYYPVFDPATPQDALRMTRYAFELSEETRLPVIMRPTTRVCHTSGVVELGPLPQGRRVPKFTKNPSRYVPIPANARRMRKELSERYAAAQELLSRSGFFPRTGRGRHGIIASGVGFAYAAQVVQELEIEDHVSLLRIGAYPIPEAILLDFLDSVESVLVVEELTPFVEDWVTGSGYRSGRMIPIFGKSTGHFPVEFEYGPDLVEDAIRSYMALEKRPQRGFDAPPLPARPPVLCPGCPHRASFYMVKKVFGKGTVYSNDIGCYTLGYGPPLEVCDLVLCMGASITQASAIARSTGKRAVALIGDSTFFHSGLPGLANAIQNEDDITVVVLNNHVTAMTGFQPSVAAAGEEGAESTPGLSIETTVHGLGLEAVYTIDPFDEESAVPVLKRAKAEKGVNVVISNSPCVIYEKRLGASLRHEPFTIDQDLCNQCSLCVRLLGCPAIRADENGYTIDSDLCDGCGLCLRVCKHEAIRA